MNEKVGDFWEISKSNNQKKCAKSETFAQLFIRNTSGSGGKEFSAKGIQESCAMNILALERKYKNSVSANSENFQNLELREHVKENLTDILLRGEKVNDYVPKQLKKKKKKIHKNI